MTAATEQRNKYRSRATQPVSDSVPKINGEVAVGEDLRFQRRWWRFEQMVWWTFAAVLVCNLAGLLGRGPLAKASKVSDDGTLRVEYERIQRFETPSMLRVQFGPGAARDGKLEVWTSESLVRDLGNQRIVPQPLSSKLDTGRLLYTFPTDRVPATVEFALQPISPGRHELELQVPGRTALRLGIFVVP